jgi:hypothetical protein
MIPADKTPGTQADAPRTSASGVEPESANSSEKTSIKRAFGEGQGRKRIIGTKGEYKMRLPPDVEQYIRDNGGSGFVVGLVRSVMPR